MNKEVFDRLKTAGEYQKKAIYALFPDHVSRHMDVIGKELKMMAVEIAADVVKECRKCDPCGGEEHHNAGSEVRKVDII